MKIVIFCHSILSDWNHGNAHFLRGLVSELAERGHAISVWEDEGAWSVSELVKDYGHGALHAVRTVYPELEVTRYDAASLDLERALAGADLVLVHEWSPPELVQRLGRERARGARFRLLFHDTHHRALTAAHEMERYDLSAYDGVLAFGEVLRELYERKGWGRRAFTFHEAADTRVFRPHPDTEPDLDLIWIGNWGDEERTAELHEFLLQPVQQLELAARAYGVRYPAEGQQAMFSAGIEYHGWLPNYRVPFAFARSRLTLHVPRRPYAETLRGIPTIRVFEALACGMPLLSAPWTDSEGLFSTGQDFLMVENGQQMKSAMRALLNDHAYAQELGRHGRSTVLRRHTCAHRADELMSVYRTIGGELTPTTSSEPAFQEAR